MTQTQSNIRGWQRNGQSIPAPEGIHAEDYFSADGAYLGPDEDGVGPIFAPTQEIKAHDQITYRVEESTDPNTALVIAECGSAMGTYVVSPDGSGAYSANPSDTDECPATADGCWPHPPENLIDEARELI